MLIHLDESGDLGWKFDAPYRRGGSSRHLTIASLWVSREKKHLPKRVIRNLYKKHNWPAGEEKKWADMEESERQDFASKALGLAQSNPDHIKLLAITVKKERVQQHIRADSNKLYNYMIGLSLIKEMSSYDDVLLLPDARSIKVGSGNSLHDYLQIKLWFDKGAQTQLTTTPCNSSTNLNVQFADMLAGAVQGHFEDGNSRTWEIIQPVIRHKRLFF